MDLLGTALQSLQIRDSSIAIMHLSRPWGFSQWALRDVVSLFMPLSGPVALQIPGAVALQLSPGDVAIGLGGEAECSSGLHAAIERFPQRWIDELPPLAPGTQKWAPVVLEWRPGDRNRDDANVMLTIALVVEDVVRSPLLAMLPRLSMLHTTDVELAPWTAALAQFVQAERHHPSPGYNHIARQIGGLIFSMMVRRHVQRADAEQASWLQGMRDPHIGPVLTQMHQQPEQPWRMERLALESGLSRSTFARRFHRLMGQPPMDYLCAVRMRRATVLLRRGERVSAVAIATGYQSEGAFRKAFSKHFNTTPQAYAQRLEA